LGVSPTIVAPAGNDFDPYLKFLKKNHIDTKHIAVQEDVATGSYFVVTDPIVDGLQETMNLDRFLQLEGKVLSEDQIEQMLQQVASALDYAHGVGIVHGSLKLTNILVAIKDHNIHLFLSDFGLNHLIGEGISLFCLCEQIASSFLQSLPDRCDQAAHINRHFINSLYFLAPEQKQLDGILAQTKADVYAFGVLTYYLLLKKIPEGCFELPSQVLKDLKCNWDLLIHKCLQSNPNLRPQKLTLAIRESLHTPISASLGANTLADLHHLLHAEEKEENVHQMAFEFPLKQEAHESICSPTAFRPILKPQEIERPQYEADPGAIFQRETIISHYIPTRVEENGIEPILTEMIVMPSKKYLRGSKEGSRDEMPRHEVNLPSFALDIHPITNEQFVRFLQMMGGEKDHNNNDIIRLRDSRIKRSGGKLIIESGYAKHPVVGVTWYGAVAYTKWIGKRLPLEAEWEAAASGGHPDQIFPTGMSIERAQANFFSSDTTPVMSYPPNPFGLYDMAGNVYEWCQDWYAYNYYDASMAEPDRPSGPPQGVYRVLRGGCWKSLKEDLRSSHRHRNNPGAVNGTYGFRCAADVIPN